MPKLSELTDVNYTGEYDPMGNALPVEKPFPELQRIYVNEPSVEQPSKGSVVARSILDKLFGQTGERYQLWPEKIVRDALSAAHDVKEGKELSNIGLRREDVTDKPVPQRGDKPDMPGVLTSVAGGILTPTASSPQDSIIEKAQAISALAGTGGLAGGAEGAVLNATPSLRPALKHKERLYKGKPGQEHQDIIPDSLYNDFQKKAMSGEDLAEYNFGFINDKGHFMTREDALKYGIDNGIIDPHSGKYGALTTTLLADSSKPGTAIEAMAKTNPFFSALEHNVSNISQGKMNGDAWLGTLSNKPGVKPEELDWTGLRSFLEENKGKPVTKQQIEQHLAENKIELKEVVKGDLKFDKNSEYALPEVIKAAREAGDTPGDLELTLANDGRAYEALMKKFPKLREDEDWAATVSKAVFGGDSMPSGTSKYHSYQLPGGENYREVLLTLPQSKLNKTQLDAMRARERELNAKDKKNLTDAEYTELAEINNKIVDNRVHYKSSHWDEPNILAHMRMNDRTIDGKKSLHLEEIQSDWHQAGRDKGYRPEQEKKLASLVEQREALQKEASTLSPSDARYKEIYKELPTLQTKINNIGSGDVGVPDAPFKKTWHELALKRALREAAEKGYDRLSWTPGEAQAARYDLSKQIKELQYLKNDDGTYQIAGVEKNGGGFNHPDNVPANKLPDIVGKEMAEKIIKNEGRRDRGQPTNGGYFSGVDLKIGGEGMKGFYDNMIPKALEKLGKEHVVKVKKANIIAPMKKMGDSGEQPVYYIDIPQSLRDTATGKGFPLFAKGGYMLQPVDYEPEFK
jgi:hypothetical protein